MTSKVMPKVLLKKSELRFMKLRLMKSEGLTEKEAYNRIAELLESCKLAHKKELDLTKAVKKKAVFVLPQSQKNKSS